MRRAERQNDFEEALAVALEGKQAEIWTALPGIIESYDPAAQTASVRPAIQGRVEDARGKISFVDLPLLLDVPVEFPAGGGFTLTFPVKPGDECMVEFQSRCLDGWWKEGGVQPPLSGRMHDLSDGVCRVGARSQKRLLSPPPDVAAVELRSDDKQAYLSIKPDKSVMLHNPAAEVSLGPDGLMRLQNALAFLLFDPAGNITLNGLNVSINAAGALNFTGASGAALVSGGNVLINGAEVKINEG